MVGATPIPFLPAGFGFVQPDATPNICRTAIADTDVDHIGVDALVGVIVGVADRVRVLVGRRVGVGVGATYSMASSQVILARF